MRTLFLLVALVGATHLASAQSPTAYRATGIRHYQSVNPHRLYLVLDGDTTGGPQQTLSVEREEWVATDSGYRVVVVDQSLNLSGRITQDTLDVAANGRVRTINGMSDVLRGRFDFIPRFPTPLRALKRGDAWSDTVSTEMSGPAGDYAFVVTRRYTVARRLDSLDRHLMEIAAEGSVRYHDVFWTDSTAGASVWMRVSGPMQERILFDVDRGELILQTWSMRLEGTGGTSAAADTVPAGLISAQTRVLIDGARADLLLRPMPAGDTALTVRLGPDGGTIFIHTVQRQGDTIAAGMLRADGMKGTTRATYRDGRPERFEAIWTDSSFAPHTITIERRGDSLVIDGPTKKVSAITTQAWGIADYGMPEHLVPLFWSLPTGDTAMVAIYRPYPATWDTLAVVTSLAPAGLVAFAQDPSDPQDQTVYVIVDGESLLFAQNTKGSGSQYVPPPGSPRRARLAKIFAGLQRK